MKLPSDKKKSAALANLAQNTADLGKKVSTGVKSNITAMVEKSRSDSYARKMKKLNPLFPEEYSNETFCLPNMIKIVDDAVRRGIDVCEGSIGWLGKEKDMEILYLYDEAVEFSGLQFIPSATCDTIYYVDNFDRNRFIRVDCIFSKAHEEKLAELEYIAYCLGAKRCTIEISESTVDTQARKRKFEIRENIRGVKSTEQAEQSLETSTVSRRTGKTITEFDGNAIPKHPELKWFAHDDTIIRLVEMCCNGDRTVKSKRLELVGASSATMSQNTAYAIDCALATMGNAKGNASMDAQAKQEHHSKFIFDLEF